MNKLVMSYKLSQKTPLFAICSRGCRKTALLRANFSTKKNQSGGDVEFSHVDPTSNLPRMVNVGDKPFTIRTATAQSTIRLPLIIAQKLFPTISTSTSTAGFSPPLQIDDTIKPDFHSLTTKKGPVFTTAIIAGTMAVKSTPTLIPFCHSLPIDSCSFDLNVDPVAGEDGSIRVHILCTVQCTYKTGVEMEALVGASTAALTVYDMCKALSQDIEIENTKVLRKSGGKSDISNP